MTLLPNKELRDKLNQIFRELQASEPKLGYQISISGILNAYREGDVTFDKARELLLGFVERPDKCPEFLVKQRDEARKVIVIASEEDLRNAVRNVYCEVCNQARMFLCVTDYANGIHTKRWLEYTEKKICQMKEKKN